METCQSCVDIDGDGVSAGTDCDDENAAVYPGQSEQYCDGIDNDCDETSTPDSSDEICDDGVDNDCDSDTDLDDEDCAWGDDDDTAGDDDDTAGDDDDTAGDDDDTAGDDDDTAGDDDDTAGDDDDTVADDDDSSVSSPPTLVDDFAGAPPTVLAGCSDCASSVGSGSADSPVALLLLLLFVVRRRRSTDNSSPLRFGALLLLSAALVAPPLLLTPVPALAEDLLAGQAARQLEFAWKEIEGKKWDKAMKSADSAMRLNPALYTAMVVKAIAYEGMGQFEDAESWLLTYLDLYQGDAPIAAAEELRVRLRAHEAAAVASAAEAAVAAEKEDAPKPSSRDKRKADRERKAKAKEKAEAEKKARAEKRAKEEAEAEKRAKEEAEAEKRAKEKAKAEKRAKEEAEAEKRAKEEAEAEKRAKEEAEAEKQAKEKAEAEKRAKEEAEAEKRAKEEAKAEKQAKEEAEAEKRAKEKAEARAQALAEARAQALAEARAEALAEDAGDDDEDEEGEITVIESASPSVASSESGTAKKEQAAKKKPSAATSGKVGAGAFGDGSVVAGALIGGRNYEHYTAEGETRPGFWSFGGAGLGAGLSVRGEYFIAGWLAGVKVGFDLHNGAPVNHNEIAASDSPGYRVDAAFAFRVPLARGKVGFKLLLDLGWSMRGWEVYENLDAEEATRHNVPVSILGGGVGVRIEPGKLLGIEARFGIGGLMGGLGGLNDGSLDVAVVIRPKGPLLIRAGFNGRYSSVVVVRDSLSLDIQDLIVGGWIGAGIAF
jgi:MYXO-CTERM domain-containing protein